jgi:hypothetical protein
MKKGIWARLLFLGYYSHAQHMFFSTFFGAAGYKGDLQPNTLSLLQAKPVGGIGLNYEITSRIFAKLEFDLARVNGDDKYNVKNRKRNLSFKSESPISNRFRLKKFSCSERYKYCN